MTGPMLHPNGNIDTLATYHSPCATREYLPSSADYAYRSVKYAQERILAHAADYDDRIRRAWDRSDYRDYKSLKEMKEKKLNELRKELSEYEEQYRVLSSR